MMGFTLITLMFLSGPAGPQEQEEQEAVPAVGVQQAATLETGKEVVDDETEREVCPEEDNADTEDYLKALEAARVKLRAHILSSAHNPPMPKSPRSSKRP